MFTLTDYMEDIEADKKMIKILLSNYKKVYFWIQGSNDIQYISKIYKGNDIVLVPPTLEAYDKILESTKSLDYVGTRLHAGIRALQKKVRTIVVAIDNRALEKSQDINLNIVKRIDIANKLENIINNDVITNIKLPLENIKIWKNQFV